MCECSKECDFCERYRSCVQARIHFGFSRCPFCVAMTFVFAQILLHITAIKMQVYDVSPA